MKIAIIGSSGSIGQAFADIFLADPSLEMMYLFSRSSKTLDFLGNSTTDGNLRVNAVLESSGTLQYTPVLRSDFPANSSSIASSRRRLFIDNSDHRVKYGHIDIEDEDSIKEAAGLIPDNCKLDLLIVATGVLSLGGIRPEKSLNELSSEQFISIYKVNTVGPALVAKYFISKLKKDNRSIFAALSARVGSISDNLLGGWYSYRCSKAALNMIIKNISIEFKNNNPNLIAVGLHPGTVDSNLSKPFVGHSKNHTIFTPEYSVQRMIEVLSKLTKKDSGKVFAWDGQEISS